MQKFLQDLDIASQWSKANFSDLPWRASRSFYHTLISEVMLQQTTVSTVKNRFEDFIKKFPDLKTLASATDDELLKAWQGLGYYSRAIRLKGVAQELQKKKTDDIELEELLKIKGIGDYTGNALLAIGLNRDGLALDVNLIRVFFRYFGVKYLKSISSSPRDLINEKIKKVLKNLTINYRELHESIMDVGRVFCQARKRDCLHCPMKKNCKTFKGNHDYYQQVVESKGTKTQKEKVVLARLLIIKNNQILLVKRQKNQWLAGQWELPTYVVEGVVPEKQYSKLKIKLDGLENVGKIKSTITKYQFENLIYNGKKIKNLRDARYFNINSSFDLALTSITKKILKQF